MAALQAHVALFDKKGMLHSFGPGDVPPPWAAKKITNPKAWGGDSPAVDQPDDSEKDAEIEQLKAEIARLQGAADSPAPDDGAGDEDESDENTGDEDAGAGDDQGNGSVEPPPPLAGPGSGRDLWAAYAAQFPDKVEVVEDDKRDDIVAKLRNASIPVE